MFAQASLQDLSEPEPLLFVVKYRNPVIVPSRK